MQTLRDLILSISAANVADMTIIACLIYFVLAWFKGTRAFQILVTLLGLGLFYIAALRMGLVLTSSLFQYLWAAIIIVVAIVFQPEIRQMLDRASPMRYLRGRRADYVEPNVIDETVKATAELARMRVGALIVFQRTDSLDTVVLKGKQLDGVVSWETLIMIFQKGSPLHDGAVLIARDRITAAGCILPLSTDESLSPRFGTRHRAALGLAERSDAVCVVVSEERGEVSVVENKEIRNYTKKADFSDALHRALILGRTLQPRRKRPGLSFIFFNWRLKLAAAAAAIFLWTIVVGPQRSEVGISAQIQYTNLPPGMEITGKWVDRVDVRVRGSEASLAGLKPESVRALVDLSDVVVGPNFFRITDKNLLVPPGVSISKIRPSDLQLKIEAASEKKFAVIPNVEGAIPAKMKVVVSPTEVLVRGLKEDLQKVKSVATEPVRAMELSEKGRVAVPVGVRPQGVAIEAIEPLQVTVSLEERAQ